jgi:GNAT superfamily N-acetyltransferase
VVSDPGGLTRAGAAPTSGSRPESFGLSSYAGTGTAPPESSGSSWSSSLVAAQSRPPSRLAISGSRRSANSRPTSSTQVHANVDRDFDKYPFVGWLVDGKVVAMMALIEPETDCWTPEEPAEPQTYISRFFVVEHGKGYGSHLLEAVTDQARKQGHRWIRPNCWSTTTALHTYYIAHGFEYVHTCHIPGRMSGALFQRELSPESGG